MPVKQGGTVLGGRGEPPDSSYGAFEDVEPRWVGNIRENTSFFVRRLLKSPPNVSLGSKLVSANVLCRQTAEEGLENKREAS